MFQFITGYSLSVAAPLQRPGAWCRSRGSGQRDVGAAAVAGFEVAIGGARAGPGRAGRSGTFRFEAKAWRHWTGREGLRDEGVLVRAIDEAPQLLLVARRPVG